MAEPNLDETMQETLREMQEAESEEVSEEVVEESVSEGPREDSSGRLHGADGKFIAKDKGGEDSGDEEIPEEEPAHQEAEGEEPESEGLTPPAPVIGRDTGQGDVAQNLFLASGDPRLGVPPATWRASAKAIWNDLPEAARVEIKKREEESRRGVEQMRDRATFADRMDKVIEPYRAVIQSKNMTPEDATQVMLNAYYVLETAHPQQKVEQILATAQQYGVLDHLVARLTNPQGYTPVDPTVMQLQAQLQELQNQLQQRDTQSETTQREAIEAELEAFANAVNEDGTQKHPYFYNVAELMANVMEANPDTNLDTAYEQALWADPETRQILLAQQAKTEEAERQSKDRADKAKRAKAANLGDKPTHGDVKPDKPTGTVLDTMNDVMAEIRNR